MQAAAQAVTSDLLALSVQGGDAFTLTLADGTTLECSRIVRRVPGKRLVCEGMWRQQAVFAKIFLGPHAARHAARDRQGSQWLTEKRLSTPTLLHASTLPDGAGEILLYQSIADSANAEDVMYNTLNGPQRLALAMALTRTVAAHHEAGLLQTDLYLKNFLVQGERIYTLDGDGIRLLPGWCARRTAISNLARLLSKLDANDDGWAAQLYQYYCEQRGRMPQPAQQKALEREVRRIRREVITEYADRKVFRECSDVHVEQDRSKFLVVARAWMDRLDSLLAAPDILLEQSTRLKTGNTCTVGLIEQAGRKIVVKRYNIKNLRHGLGRALRKSRAALSWANTYRLRIAGIATAAPVALLEQRWGFIRRRAWFLAEYVAGPDVGAWMAEVAPQQRQQVAMNVAQLLHKMQRLRFAHGDLKAANIKIVDMQPVLIDLDSLKEYRWDWLFRRRHARDLRRLLRNWEHDAALLEPMRQALRDVYGNDPVLAAAGVM
ncbi:MAG TPA: lipopolysaccharide kinase InaA family protein [Novimethylophilus sp.]|jgi:tRNA A-37 threonylcarbamoyl transferase component Bud32|uniref:lipopolysaccharide kinase InaA family protein n=1 Tax=Novimethylophilus sp. TaxID=2137426 RepID=UPI002F426F6E